MTTTDLRAARQPISQEPGEPLSIQVTVAGPGVTDLRLSLFDRQGLTTPLPQFNLLLPSATGSTALFTVAGSLMTLLGTGVRWYEVLGLIDGARQRLIVGPLNLIRSTDTAPVQPPHFELTLGPTLSVTIRPWVTQIVTGPNATLFTLPAAVPIVSGRLVANVSDQAQLYDVRMPDHAERLAGIALTGADQNETVLIQPIGRVSIPGWGLWPGQTYRAGAAGVMEPGTPTPGAVFSQVVGKAISASVFQFQPQSIIRHG